MISGLCGIVLLKDLPARPKRCARCMQIESGSKLNLSERNSLIVPIQSSPTDSGIPQNIRLFLRFHLSKQTVIAGALFNCRFHIG